MGAWASIIAAAVGTGIKLLGSSGGPSYPSPPKLAKIDVPGSTKLMEDYESQRMQTSIDQWKQKFPLLYQGGAAEIGNIMQQQQGQLGGTLPQDLASSGLAAPRQGNQYQLSQDIGLSPITLSQRTSQAVTRQIAANPEWTNQISGGTLASMMANNYQNQNAFSQFLGAKNTAMYAQGQAAGAYNTQALLSGVTGIAGLGAQAYGQGQYGPTSPIGQGIYGYQQQQQPALPGMAGGSPYMQGPGMNWGPPAPSPMYSGAFSQGGPMGMGGMGTGYGMGGNMWDPNQFNANSLSGPMPSNPYTQNPYTNSLL